MALETLGPHKQYLRELRARGVTFSFFIGWFSDHNSRDVIGWEILRDMAELGLSLDLDVYGPDSNAVSGEKNS